MNGTPSPTKPLPSANGQHPLFMGKSPFFGKKGHNNTNDSHADKNPSVTKAKADKFSFTPKFFGKEKHKNTHDSHAEKKLIPTQAQAHKLSLVPKLDLSHLPEVTSESLTENRSINQAPNRVVPSLVVELDLHEVHDTVKIEMTVFTDMFDAINILGFEFVEDLCHSKIDGSINDPINIGVMTKLRNDYFVDLKWLIESDQNCLERLLNTIATLKDASPTILRAFLPEGKRENYIEVLSDSKIGFDGYKIMARCGRIFVIDTHDRNRETELMSTAKFLSHCDIELKGLNLSGLHLRGANFSRLNLQDVNLSDAVLIDVDLSGANLQGADFAYTKLSGADLSRANLKDTYFDHADLCRADLRQADLRGSDLRYANFTFANLQWANLTKVRSTLTDFNSADLRGTNLHGTDMSNAYMDGVKVIGTKIDDKTRFSILSFGLPPIWDEDSLTQHLTGTIENGGETLLTFISQLEYMNSHILKLKLTLQLIDSLKGIDITNVRDELCRAIMSDAYITSHKKALDFLTENGVVHGLVPKYGVQEAPKQEPSAEKKIKKPTMQGFVK